MLTAKQHELHFGWRTFRVLTVTTDQHRMQSMQDALRRLADDLPTVWRAPQTERPRLLPGAAQILHLSRPNPKRAPDAARTRGAD
mgnify:CR=1 FL=1